MIPDDGLGEEGPGDALALARDRLDVRAATLDAQEADLVLRRQQVEGIEHLTWLATDVAAREVQLRTKEERVNRVRDSIYAHVARLETALDILKRKGPDELNRVTLITASGAEWGFYGGETIYVRGDGWFHWEQIGAVKRPKCESCGLTPVELWLAGGGCDSCTPVGDTAGGV